MGKRRRLSERELVNLRKAKRDGYRSFRYGSSRPVSLPRIFTGEKRRHMVSRVLDVLRDWRLSPFEHEGSTRAGIRSGLVMIGHGWHQSDQEAEALIAEGLHLMGAKRPTWAQGQPEYVIARENCAQCGGPLDQEAIANHDRFCSHDCRRIMQTWRNANYHNAMASRARWAYEVTRKEGIPERRCEWCGDIFKPATPDAATCCPEHAAKLREQRAGRAIPDRQCKNPACGKTFHPATRHVEYCRLECHREHQAAMLGTALCENPDCGKPFEKRYAFAKYCGGKCRKAVERGKALPPKPCAHCGEMFGPKQAKNIYCSRSCARRDRDCKASAFMCEEVKEAA